MNIIHEQNISKIPKWREVRPLVAFQSDFLVFYVIANTVQIVLFVWNLLNNLSSLACLSIHISKDPTRSANIPVDGAVRRLFQTTQIKPLSSEVWKHAV